MRPTFSLNLPDPRYVRASVTHEDWDPWTEHASPLHSGWYGDPHDWASGLVAWAWGGTDAAMRVSVVNRCVSLRANMIASLPCKLLEQRGDTKEVVRDHPAYFTVRRQPNAWQTRFQFFRDMQAKHDLHGAAFGRLRYGPDRITISPLDPDRVEVEQLKSERLRFRYRPPDGRVETILQDEMFYLRDLSGDFLTGMAKAKLAREAIAVARVAEQFVSRFFVNDAGGRLVLKHPGRFESVEKRKETESYIRQEVMGALNAHRPFVAWGGLEVQELAKAKDTDFIVEPRTFQAADIARFWGCPGVLIGLEEKTSSWGTGVWEIKQGFVDFTIKPEAINWQESLEQALLTDEERGRLVFEFEFGSLLQANPQDQAQTFGVYIERGVMSRNEVRARLNMNPREGGDEYQDTVPGAAPNPDRPTAPTENRVSPQVDHFTIIGPNDARTQRVLMELWPEPEATPTRRADAIMVPHPLVADVAERVTDILGRGGQEARAEKMRRTLQPLITTYGLSTALLDTLVGRLESVHSLATGSRGPAVLAILEAALRARQEAA